MKAAPLLIAEDDDDDFRVISEALKQARCFVTVRRVKDGEELMDYLLHRGGFAAGADTPALILLDLNMPRKDGREALREIKATPGLQGIPVVVLTVSREQEDVIHSYGLGLNAFVRKPNDIAQFIDVVKLLKKFWLDAASLPEGGYVPPPNI